MLTAERHSRTAMLSNESADNAYWQTFVIASEMMPGSEPLAAAMLSGSGSQSGVTCWAFLAQKLRAART